MRGGPFVRAIALRTAIGATAMSGAGYTAQYRDLRGAFDVPMCPPREQQVTGIVVHHDAIDAKPRTYDDAKAFMGRISKRHVERFNCGPSYHYYVWPDGEVWYMHDVDRKTAHTAGANTRNLAICAGGNMERNAMPAAQRSSLIALVYYLREIYGTAYIHPHCHYSPTLCPGKGTHDAVGHLWDGTLNCKR